MSNSESKAPLVSICCITYNHVKFIRDCLEGFLCQKTTFPYEILIHDDASTDGTQNIIREYQKRFPNIIKPILQTENQYSQGKNIGRFNTDRACGRYLAVCEGDDFWCNSNKLQSQFDFMEAHPDYSLCGCSAWVMNHFSHTISGKAIPWDFPPSSPESTRAFYFREHPFLTSGLFYRRDSFQLIREKYFRDLEGAAMGDALLMFHLSLVGKVAYIPRLMTVYRIAAGSAMAYGNPQKSQRVHQKQLETAIRLANNNGFSVWANELLEREKTDKENSSRAYRKPDLRLRTKLLHAWLHILRGDFYRYLLYQWNSHLHHPIILKDR